MRAWQERFGKKGFTVIAVHTPEFSWERPEASVRKAVAKYQINYPVVIDSDYVIWKRWRRVGLRGWPTSFLIDKQGIVRHMNFGPANSSMTNLIEGLLAEPVK